MHRWRESKLRVLSAFVLLAILISLTTGVSLAQGDRLTEAAYTASSRPEESLETHKETPQVNSQGQEISLEQAVRMAVENNPEVLTVTQDVYLREQDLEKARYFADKITDTDERADKGEEMLDLLKSQLAATPEDSPMYGYLEQQIEVIEEKLAQAEPYRINNYNNAKVAYLYVKQAEAGLRLTVIGEKTAKQKIGLLASKQYFDAVKYKKLADLKKAALTRAEEQAKAAKASVEAGFRAKDDYLLAKAQAELMNADYRKAILDREAAETELKSTIGMDQSIKLVLTGYREENIKSDLSKALQQGLLKRFEIQKAAAELDIARLNYQLAQSYLGPGVVDYEQARINVNKAEIELDRQKRRVQKEIYQAYYSLTAAEDMSATVKSTSQLARESAEIAQYRYLTGFSLPSPVMKALNAEDLAGTTVEVLAAQEKFIEVEEKIIEINYSLNLAGSNYLFSIGEGL